MFRRVAVALVLAASCTAVSAVFAAPRSSASAEQCFSYGYACTPSYTGSNTAGTWAWTYYGGNVALTANGYHNCTLYAAWCLEENGMADPGNWGNADDWVSHTSYNHTPVVGSIAWWGGGKDGHVAYVDQVSGAQVHIVADNFISATSDGYTDSGWIAASSVDEFLHPHDLGAGMLEFIKTKNTQSVKVELFEIPDPNYESAPSVATPTWFSPGDANNGWFQMDGK